MMHLSPETLVDLAEGGHDASADVHLEACARCREEVASLRAALAEVVAVHGDVPEPSPLFWDHLSARVRAAVAEDPPAAPWWRASWRPMAAGLAAAAVLVLAVAVLAPAPTGPAVTSSVEMAAVTLPPLDVADDASLDWLADLASDVEWGDALIPGDAAAVAVDDLNDAERVELHRILQEALAQPGV